MGHGSSVTTSVQSVEPPGPDGRGRVAQGQHLGVGRRIAGQLRARCGAGRRTCPSASSTTAPTGTSSCASAARASSSAMPMASSQSVIRQSGPTTQWMAETVGFEPTVSCPTHDFQSCRFVRSRTSPNPRCSHTGSASVVAVIGRDRYAALRRVLVRRSGPVQPEPVNRVRAGRQQLSAEPLVCRRSPDRLTRTRPSSRPVASGGRLSVPMAMKSSSCGHVEEAVRRHRGAEPAGPPGEERRARQPTSASGMTRPMLPQPPSHMTWAAPNSTPWPTIAAGDREPVGQTPHEHAAEQDLLGERGEHAGAGRTGRR